MLLHRSHTGVGFFLGIQYPLLIGFLLVISHMHLVIKKLCGLHTVFIFGLVSSTS